MYCWLLLLLLLLGYSLADVHKSHMGCELDEFVGQLLPLSLRVLVPASFAAGVGPTAAVLFPPVAAAGMLVRLPLIAAHTRVFSSHIWNAVAGGLLRSWCSRGRLGRMLGLLRGWLYSCDFLHNLQ